MSQRARSLTYHLADLKAKYNKAQTEAHESTTRLACANAHDHLMTRILTEVMEDQTLAPRICQQGLDLINNSDTREPVREPQRVRGAQRPHMTQQRAACCDSACSVKDRGI
jgi:hypothetical protein